MVEQRVLPEPVEEMATRSGGALERSQPHASACTGLGCKPAPPPKLATQLATRAVGTGAPCRVLSVVSEANEPMRSPASGSDGPCIREAVTPSARVLRRSVEFALSAKAAMVRARSTDAFTPMRELPTEPANEPAMEAAKPPILEPATEAARLPISSSSSSSSSLSAAALAALSASAAASSASACLSCATILLACSEARARDRWCDAFASCLAVFLLAPIAAAARSKCEDG